MSSDITSVIYSHGMSQHSLILVFVDKEYISVPNLIDVEMLKTPGNKLLISVRDQKCHLRSLETSSSLVSHLDFWYK